MKKFDEQARVIIECGGAKQRGRVTGVGSRTRRVVTDSGSRLCVPMRNLRLCPDRALILETRLDRSLRSGRSYGPMMQQWLSAHGVEALYERVHTTSGLRYFLGREGREVSTRFVHIMVHGRREPGTRKGTLRLTFERLRLMEEVDMFSGLTGKIILLSCCEIGGDKKLMQAIKHVSGAAAVIAYRVSVEDWYTNLVEVLLYERLVNSTMTPHRAVDVVGRTLCLLGARGTDRPTRGALLVCF